MRTATRTLALLPLVAAFALACATAGPERPEQVETRDETGFQIVEEVRAGGGARSDFEDAVRLLEQGEYDRAIERLLEVTESSPNVTAVHIDLGMAYAKTERLEQAQESLERALELNPRHPVAWNELGIVHRRQGHFDDARKSYDQALSFHPEFHYARRNLAILCDVYLADLECALANYERYLETSPADETTAMWAADLRTRLGRLGR